MTGAARGLLQLLGGRLRTAAKFDGTVARMLAGLAQTKASDYEAGLVELGALLGARSFKPAGDGRADAAWLWPSGWITVEAKTEQKAEGLLSLDYVRQANTQLDSLAADEEVDDPPASSVSLIVTPRPAVEPDAVAAARAHLHLVGLTTMADLAHDAVRAARQIRTALPAGANETAATTVMQILWEHRVLPTQVRERLTRNPTKGR